MFSDRTQSNFQLDDGLDDDDTQNGPTTQEAPDIPDTPEAADKAARQGPDRDPGTAAGLPTESGEGLGQEGRG